MSKLFKGRFSIVTVSSALLLLSSCVVGLEKSYSNAKERIKKHYKAKSFNYKSLTKGGLAILPIIDNSKKISTSIKTKLQEAASEEIKTPIYKIPLKIINEKQISPGIINVFRNAAKTDGNLPIGFASSLNYKFKVQYFLSIHIDFIKKGKRFTKSSRFFNTVGASINVYDLANGKVVWKYKSVFTHGFTVKSSVESTLCKKHIVFGSLLFLLSCPFELLTAPFSLFVTSFDYLVKYYKVERPKLERLLTITIVDSLKKMLE